MYTINSNGWDYTITNVSQGKNGLEFKFTRKPDCKRPYDIEPNYHHRPHDDKAFIAQIIKLESGK